MLWRMHCERGTDRKQNRCFIMYLFLVRSVLLVYVSLVRYWLAVVEWSVSVMVLQWEGICCMECLAVQIRVSVLDAV